MKTALTDAGLGSKKRLTTNRSESVNHVLKEAAEYEEMSLPELIALAKAVADSQRLDVVRAIVRKGKYRLKKEFSFLEVSESKWMHEMDRSQRDRHLQLVLQTELEASKGQTAAGGTSPSTFSMSYGEAKLSHILDKVLVCPSIPPSQIQSFKSHQRMNAS